MGTASYGNRSTTPRYLQIIKIIPSLPFELQSRIWNNVIFQNFDLSKIVDLFGHSDQIDYFLNLYFCSKVFIVSRFLGGQTYLSVETVRGSILINSEKFLKLMNLVKNGVIKIQKLAFQREIGDVLALNQQLFTLLESANKLCHVFYDQLEEYRRVNIITLNKIDFLSLSSLDNLTCFKMKELSGLLTIVLNIWNYPVDTKILMKNLMFFIKLKRLNSFTVTVLIDRNLQLPGYLFEALRKIALNGASISVHILDNSLTYQNMKFEWLVERLSDFCYYITDVNISLNSDTFIDLQPLDNYYCLERLKISVLHSNNKNGIFRVKNKQLKSLSLSYFDKNINYSMKGFPGLIGLNLTSCEVSENIMISIPQTLKFLILSNCYFEPKMKVILPPGLKHLTYEMKKSSSGFPNFSNFQDLALLNQLKLAISSALPQSFFNKLPQKLKIMIISADTLIDWLSMDFSNLKSITHFQIMGKSMEYDLKLLPPLVQYLNFKHDVSVFKNSLPATVEVLDISFSDLNIPISSSINEMIRNRNKLRKLVIKGNRDEYDFTRLDYGKLKAIEIHISYGKSNAKIKIKIGNIPITITNFLIFSDGKETILSVPKCELADHSKLSRIGILEGVTEMKESELPLINIGSGLEKLKIDNVSNRMRNENEKKKQKLKKFLRRH
ncbi:hypothetical protein DAPK24_014780 [Pichia kluyveri]|uniref:Uncharacterized protein n=1 Tax=Pichia kluyveri TaxID=36015 RepID=A0AAV5R122_PICKL|nr:hypothetical protein DAPK24_014780 [Pichia kluyveri]